MKYKSEQLLSELKKNNRLGLSDEVLEHYRKMDWKIRLVLSNTCVTMGLGAEFQKKVIETCYYGKHPGSQESSDRQIVWDLMKWNSKDAADTYSGWLQSLEEEERKVQGSGGSVQN